MAEKGHIHKFQRHTFKTGNAVYFCVLDCGFKIAVPLALGKKCICWRCGNVFVMSEYSTRLAKPHCNACHKVKGVNQFNEDRAEFKAVPVMPPPVIEERVERAGDLTSRLRMVTKVDEEEDI